MNIIFFGSSEFAVPSLKALISNSYKVSCVVTQPDKQKGRGLLLAPTVIKTVAEESSLTIYQPQRINAPEAIKFLRDLNPDLFVVVSYGQILSREILEIPKIFPINVHGSLLPKYRGAAPINWAIINGEKTTGISIIKITEKLDAGPIILQKKVDISDDGTSVTLENTLSLSGAELLIDSLKRIANNDYTLTDQEEDKVIFAPKLKKQDGLIDWQKCAKDIYNLIRGCVNWPGAFTYYHARLLKIYRAEVIPLSGCPVAHKAGEIIKVSKDGIIVATGEDNLIIEELQIEGARRMGVEEFIAGHKIQLGEILAKK